jgi:predicted alpha/beta-hydrolase family hydrolase
LTLFPKLDGPDDARWTLLLSHGAGASTASSFCDELWGYLLKKGSEIGGLRVARFDFPYMEKWAITGRRHPPDRMLMLQQAYREAVGALTIEHEHLVIGGKSMGGRVASLIANDLKVAGLVCLGYPFHPRGQPEKLRTAHLERLSLPALICQGTRDPMGSMEDVEGYQLSPMIRFEWLPDGDHDLVPRKRSGHTRAGNFDTAATAIIRFFEALNRPDC